MHCWWADTVKKVWFLAPSVLPCILVNIYFIIDVKILRYIFVPMDLYSIVIRQYVVIPRFALWALKPPPPLFLIFQIRRVFLVAKLLYKYLCQSVRPSFCLCLYFGSVLQYVCKRQLALIFNLGILTRVRVITCSVSARHWEGDGFDAWPKLRHS